MEITCKHCQARQEFNESQLSGEATELQCSACGRSFVVDAADHVAPFRIRLRATGQVVTQVTPWALKEDIEAERFGPDDELSRSGSPWIRLRDVPELEDMFERDTGTLKPGAMRVSEIVDDLNKFADASSKVAPSSAEEQRDEEDGSDEPVTIVPPAATPASAQESARHEGADDTPPAPEVKESPTSAAAQVNARADDLAESLMQLTSELGLDDVRGLPEPGPPSTGPRATASAVPQPREDTRDEPEATATAVAAGQPLRTEREVYEPPRDSGAEPASAESELEEIEPEAIEPIEAETKAGVTPDVDASANAQATVAPDTPAQTVETSEAAQASEAVPSSEPGEAAQSSEAVPSSKGTAPAQPGKDERVSRPPAAANSAEPRGGSSAGIWIGLMVAVAVAGWLAFAAIGDNGGSAAQGTQTVTPSPATPETLPPASEPGPAVASVEEPGADLEQPVKAPGSAAPEGTSEEVLAADEQEVEADEGTVDETAVDESESEDEARESDGSEQGSEDDEDEMPPGYVGRLQRGEFKLKWRTPDDAIPYFEAALELRPAGLEALEAMGRALLAKGEPRRARKYLERAAHSGYTDAYIGLGDAHAALHHPIRAVRSYESYLEEAPDGPRAQYARERLGELGSSGGDSEAE